MPVATEARRLRRKNPYDAYISYESSSNDPTARNVKAHLGSGVHPSWKAFFERGPWFGGSNEVVNPLYLKDPYQPGWNEQYGVNYKNGLPRYITRAERDQILNNLLGSEQDTENKRAYPELLEEAKRLLLRDQARLATSNYPVYKGNTTVPMSTLTQRAQELSEHYANKPAPYSKKINAVLNRNNQGLSQEGIRSLLDILNQGQRNFTQENTLGYLQRHFGDPYQARADRFNRKNEKDLNRGITEYSGKLDDLNRALVNVENEQDNELLQTLGALQGSKKSRRDDLIKNLEHFGNQKHAHTNLVNQGNKQLFEQEQAIPYQRMKHLEQAINQYDRDFVQRQEYDPDNIANHPDLDNSKKQLIEQSLRAYGIDPKAPSNKWSITNQNLKGYPGKLVADINPEMQQSFNLAERISSSFKTENTVNRKELERSLVNASSIGAVALENVPDALRGQIARLQYEAKKRLKGDLATIENKYLRLGQNSSPQHMREAEERSRYISNALLDKTNELLENRVRNEASLTHDKRKNDMNRLAQIAALEQGQYNDAWKRISDLNRVGNAAWRHEQNKLENDYNNYRKEQEWQWPHLRGALGHGNISNNYSLEQLARTNPMFSAIEKERSRLPLDINDPESFRRAF